MKLSGLYIYPVKSLPGISLTEAIAEERGMQYDRRWMLVDSKNNFITLRKEKKLQKFSVKGSVEGVEIIYENRNLHLPWKFNGEKYTEVSVWGDKVEAIVGEEYWNEWFSNIVGYTCRLVYMGPDHIRRIKHQWSKYSKEVSFADAYPYLVVGDASRKKLSVDSGIELDIQRFRPNIVFSGGPPFDEFYFGQVQIGEVILQCLKPCERCLVITIDPVSGVQNKSPLKVLSKQKIDNKVIFGQHASLIKGGMMQIGDKVEVITRKETPYEPL